MPEIEQLVRFDNLGNILFRNKKLNIMKTTFSWQTQPSLKFFTHQVLYGNPDKSLTDPNRLFD